MPSVTHYIAVKGSLFAVETYIFGINDSHFADEAQKVHMPARAQNCMMRLRQRPWQAIIGMFCYAVFELNQVRQTAQRTLLLMRNTIMQYVLWCYCIGQ